VKRQTSKSRKLRNYLTPSEVQKIITAARSVGRYGHRDATLILLTYIHGLRVSELTGLQWTDVDYRSGSLHVRRAKGSLDGRHPITGEETRALRKLQKDAASPSIFVTERGGPMSSDAVQVIVRRAGEIAGIGFRVHPHMLRHACGYKLANDARDTRAIQGYLGHANISNTVRYTQLSASRFKGFF